MSFAHKAVTAGLALTISLGMMVPVAYADPASDLAAAEERLASLGGQLGELQGQLNTLASDLERTDNEIYRTQEEIKGTEERLAAARQALSARMRSGYKTGGYNFFEFLLSSSSFEDFSSRVYYLDKIVGQDQAVISEVKDIEAELNEQMGTLQTQRDDQAQRVETVKAQVGEYDQLVSEARAYYSQLDAEVQAQLAAQAAAAAQQASTSGGTSEVATVVQAIEQQQAAEVVTEAPAPSEPTYVEPEPTYEEPEPTYEEPEPTYEESEPTYEEPEPTYEEDTSYPYPGGGVASAYSCLGWPYVWGGFGPSMGGFDCSGLVSYCYADGSSRWGAEPMGLAIQAAGLWKSSMDELSYGDLIFTDSEFNHVGIYIGDGMMIHAPHPGRVVCVQEIYSFYGGGPFVRPW